MEIKVLFVLAIGINNWEKSFLILFDVALKRFKLTLSFKESFSAMEDFCLKTFGRNGTSLIFWL